MFGISLILVGAVLVAAIAGATFLVAIMLRRVVPTNMVHIVQSSRKTTPYGRNKEAGNTYYAWPSWVPIIGISVIEFQESIFQVSLDSYEAYDQARLPFTVDVTAFFRIEQAETAAQRVASFTELENQLTAVLQGAVRRILATNQLESILQSRSELGDQFTTEVKNQIAEWGVLPVKTIEFMDIRDSSKGQVIANIMDKEKSRIEKESRVAIAENHRAAEVAEIDAKRTVEVQRQDAEQQVGLRTAAKDQAVGIANEKASQEVKAEAKVTAERNMAVMEVEKVRSAEIAKSVAKVEAERDQQVKVIAADADKKVTVVAAEANKDSVTIKAEGELFASLREAEATKAIGDAKASAEKAMLLAPVDTQIVLAKEIGANAGYQEYLISIKKVEAGQAVGIEMAGALKGADLKVIANSGDIQGGVAKLGDLFTPQGGTNLTGMLAALGQTSEGKQLISKITGITAQAESK
ncbi:MAG: flotillin [Pseudomonadota bacterium]|jgi:flotillin|nr:flotillin [Pseudomonadota bacterium]MDQ5942371.1 flotillin [Pseudomonadota bacterium]